MAHITDEQGYNQCYRPTKALQVRTERRCKHILDEFGPLKKGRVIELGSGTGEMAYMLARQTKMKVTGIDISASFIKQARKKYNIKNLAFENFDFEDDKSVQKYLKKGTVDFIVGNGLLHHLFYNLDASLARIFTMLNPGGKIIFYEPNLLNPYCYLIFNFNYFRKKAKLEPDEMAFSKTCIRQALEKNGYNNINVRYIDFLLPNTPDVLIKPIMYVGDIVEKIPLLNILAQSLFIVAEKK